MNAMDEALLRRRVGEARVARLATVGAQGRPHVVPICFAMETEAMYFAVDHKPKRTADLQRLRNIAANPSVAVLVDHYDEDWRRVWWVRVDGHARVLRAGETDRAVALLVARYEQYANEPPAGPAVEIRIERISGWSASS